MDRAEQPPTFNSAGRFGSSPAQGGPGRRRAVTVTLELNIEDPISTYTSSFQHLAAILRSLPWSLLPRWATVFIRSLPFCLSNTQRIWAYLDWPLGLNLTRLEPPLQLWMVTLQSLMGRLLHTLPKGWLPKVAKLGFLPMPISIRWRSTG